MTPPPHDHPDHGLDPNGASQTTDTTMNSPTTRTTTTTTTTLTLALLCAVCAPAPSAWAQDPGAPGDEPSGEVAGARADDEPARRKVARALFDQGTRAYTDKEFAEAGALFLEAYTYLPEAVFLYNAARCAEQTENWAQARDLAGRAAAQTERALGPELAGKARALEAVARQNYIDEHASTFDWSAVGYAGAGLGALGAAGLVGALVISTDVVATRDELSARRTPADYDALAGELSGAQATGQVLLYTGGALAATGLGLIAWDLLTPGDLPHESVPTPTLTVDPANSAVHTGVRLKF
jgi:hypothetical protein